MFWIPYSCSSGVDFHSSVLPASHYSIITVCYWYIIQFCIVFAYTMHLIVPYAFSTHIWVRIRCEFAAVLRIHVAFYPILRVLDLLGVCRRPITPRVGVCILPLPVIYCRMDVLDSTLGVCPLVVIVDSCWTTLLTVVVTCCWRLPPIPGGCSYLRSVVKPRTLLPVVYLPAHSHRIGLLPVTFPVCAWTTTVNTAVIAQCPVRPPHSVPAWPVKFSYHCCYSGRFVCVVFYWPVINVTDFIAAITVTAIPRITPPDWPLPDSRFPVLPFLLPRLRAPSLRYCWAQFFCYVRIRWILPIIPFIVLLLFRCCSFRSQLDYYLLLFILFVHAFCWHSWILLFHWCVAFCLVLY